jgi:DNA polymerase-3 subunit alpha
LNYTELHLHDYYSALDGLNSPAEYMQRASELGMTHLAETNHGTLGGHLEFQKAAMDAGITPILGLEAYISPTDRFDRRASTKREDGTSVYNHIILLAESATGLRTLNRLSQTAWEEGYYFKPRMDSELLLSDHEGLIVLSGCMSGLIPKALLNEDVEQAYRWANLYKEALGDSFFIEVQGHNPPGLNEALLSIADELGIGAVATSDCHYARKEDLWIEEAMLILSTNPKPDRTADLSKAKKMDILERLNYLYPERRMSFQEFEIFLRDRPSHLELFEKQGITREDIYDNTMEIAKRITEYPYYEGLDLLPNPGKDNPEHVLRSKVKAGLRRLGLDSDPVSVARCEEEIQIIVNKGFETYILIIEDAISWARSKGIAVGPGRGSAAGSMVCYALGITSVNPIEHGLLFFRFIDPARDDFPDVDMDFADKRRGEVKEYVRQKYGHVASIATFNTFGGKSSLKDAARVFRIPVAEVNRATKNNDAPPNAYYFDFFDVSEKGREFNKKHPEVVDLAKRLYGKLRGSGMHAAGLIISKEPIAKYAPMETAKDPNDTDGPRIPYVAMDMNQVAELGFIKLDFLGLKAMTVIDDTVNLIADRHRRKIDILAIDREDQNVYHMLSQGYTKGVFQCEAVPYTNLIVKMGGVHSFAELAASNALVRPGAANTIGAEYIDRKNGKPFNYVHMDAKWFTEETYGEVLYQEQVMLMMTDIAGMSMSDANKVRKIIGKKKDPAEFEAFRQKFIDGASDKISEKKAAKLWNDFEAHAGYSFNKSHAVAYSLISYVTAWLKYYYPLEFMAATLRNEKDDDAITDYLIEAKRLGIPVRIPHINKSKARITIEDDALRLGLVNIKYIGDKAAKAIVHHRPYNNYAHLLEVVDTKGSGVSTRMLSSMNAVGAAVFEDNPKTGRERDNFYEYLKIPAFQNRDLEPRVKAKFRELDEYEEKGAFPILAMVRGIKRGDGWARLETLDESGSAGIFTAEDTLIEAGQMYAILVSDNRVARYMTMEELYEGTETPFSRYLYDDTPELEEGQYYVISFQPYTTKANKQMAYLVLQDYLGHLLPVMAFPTLYNQARIYAGSGKTVKLNVVETEDGSLFIKEFDNGKPSRP